MILSILILQVFNDSKIAVVFLTLYIPLLSAYKLLKPAYSVKNNSFLRIRINNLKDITKKWS